MPFRPGSAWFVASLVLVLLAILIPLKFLDKFIFPPAPDKIVVFVNGDELLDPTQPVAVQIGKPVLIQVQVFVQDKPRNPGEFSYQWCFDPPVEENRLCLVDNYRAETNIDYKPKNSEEQKLKIIILHDFLNISPIQISFKPE